MVQLQIRIKDSGDVLSFTVELLPREDACDTERSIAEALEQLIEAATKQVSHNNGVPVTIAHIKETTNDD
jgi:hypothetical protein